MLESKIKKPKKKKWRVPPDFRLVDFHKPLLPQPPVILLVLGTGVAMIIAIAVAFYGGSH